MKTLLLMTVWMIGCSMTAFTQHSLKGKSTTRVLKSDHPVLPNGDSLNITGKLNVPFNSKDISGPDLKSRELNMGKQAVEKTKNLASMPVLKPKDSYHMPVYKPDSSIRFTLLIKDYRGFPNKEVK